MAPVNKNELDLDDYEDLYQMMKDAQAKEA